MYSNSLHALGCLALPTYMYDVAPNIQMYAILVSIV